MAFLRSNFLFLWEDPQGVYGPVNCLLGLGHGNLVDWLQGLSFSPPQQDFIEKRKQSRKEGWVLKSCPYFAPPAPHPLGTLSLDMSNIYLPRCLPIHPKYPLMKISPKYLLMKTSPVSLSSKCSFLLPSPFNSWHLHATSQIKSLSFIHDCAFSFTNPIWFVHKISQIHHSFSFFYPSLLPYFPSFNLIFIVMLACSLASDSSLAPGILPLPQISFHTSASVTF